MRGTLNVHKVFNGTLTKDGFIEALNLTNARKQSLRDARDKVREQLGKELPKFGAGHRLVRLQQSHMADNLPTLRPRFRMQGSAAYHTLNGPAHPPQEVDFDDGLFLPTSFVTVNNTAEPLLVSNSYFLVVESILQPLCNKEGWRLVKDKSTCVRIQIDPTAHIDLPLYAIPDVEYQTLSLASASTRGNSATTENNEIEFAEAVYRTLGRNKIMLAHRDEGWKPSDPRAIEDWVIQAVADHDEIIRRVWRYLKGWRDYQWEKGGPSSITLMACVVDVFDDLKGSIPKDRDDIAIQIVAERLGDLFSASIPNPVISDQRLDSDWTPEQREQFIYSASELSDTIDTILHRLLDKTRAIKGLQDTFGMRIPDDEELVSFDSKEETVLAFARSIVPSQDVPRTVSG